MEEQFQKPDRLEEIIQAGGFGIVNTVKVKKRLIDFNRHANYLNTIWMLDKERRRLIKKLGLSPLRLILRGYTIMITHQESDYHISLVKNEIVTICSYIKEKPKKPFFKIEHEIYDGNGDLTTTWSNMNLFVKRGKDEEGKKYNRKCYHIPEHVYKKFDKHFG